MKIEEVASRTAEYKKRFASADAEGKKHANLPDGWAGMSSIPVPKGPSETLHQRQAVAIQDFLAGRSRDSDGKSVVEYSEAKQKWLRSRVMCQPMSASDPDYVAITGIAP